MVGKQQILQWNLNGLRTRLPRLQSLVSELQPKIIAIQEHKMNDISFNFIRGYNTYSFCRPVAGGGGVSIAVCQSLPSVQIPLQTNLEAVACKIYFNNLSLHLCNVYFNDQAQIDVQNLGQLIDAIPSPKLILGDFNAKHQSWGSPTSDARGDMVSQVFLNHYLHLLNDGSPTYYRAYQDLSSHLDLTFCSGAISNRFKWEVYHDQLSSDHYPIFIAYDIAGFYATKCPKWKFSEADWRTFNRVVSLPDLTLDHNVFNLSIVSAIMSSCNLAIPKTGTRVNSKYCCFWWTPGCKEALSKAKRQFRTLRRFWSPANVAEHRRLEAIATRTLLEAKSVSWQQYLSTVNKDTSIKTLWNVINSLSGKPRSFEKIILKTDIGDVADPGDVAEEFGIFFSTVSSNENYSDDFLLHKVEEEFTPVNFPPDDSEEYNAPFSLGDLSLALKSCEDSSPGEDGVRYLPLQKLPAPQLAKLLSFYNYLWANGLFPDQWSTAIVLPFLKPGKPKHVASSYRPISLTSCLSKVMEKMVLFRLAVFLERRHFVKPYQSGFRKLHSTLDPLVRFENAIQDSFKKGEYLVAVFIDLEKAYDMVWRHLVLKILHSLGLKGNLPTFIKNFLSNRKIKVKIGDVLSRSFTLENGLPQGSVLSCILFSLIINSIFDNIFNITKSLFCDDGLFWAVGTNLEDVMSRIQVALDAIGEWCSSHGPKISVVKTHFNIFTKKTKDMNRIPILTFNGSPLKRLKKVKYLGVTFDQGLTWGPHIDNLVNQCRQPAYMMRRVSKNNWGGDRATLRKMYISLIRSKLDYASFLYSNAAHEHLQKLDRIQYAAIRLITGNHRFTVLENLEAEAHLMPLALRRKLLALNYFGKVSRLPDHPVTLLYNDFYHYQFYDVRPHTLPIVGRVKALAGNLNLPIASLENIDLADLYTPIVIDVRFSLLRDKKSCPVIRFQTEYRDLVNSTYLNFCKIFTDGSKTAVGCGCAFFVDSEPPVTVSKRLPSTCGIFNAELYALLQALKFIADSDLDNFVIFTDSYSSLLFLKNPRFDHWIKIQIYKILLACNKTIVFEWVAGHSGIHGNGVADSAAKGVISSDDITNIPLAYDDYKFLVKNLIYGQWQMLWSGIRCRLRDFKPVLGDWKSAYRDNRVEEKLLSRLRTGSCYFLYQHNIDAELDVRDKVRCTPCNVVMSIDHLLITCPALQQDRRRILSHLSSHNLVLNESNILSDDFDHTLLFDFLKKANFYSKI